MFLGSASSSPLYQSENDYGVKDPDLVIVGGGIAGGALALVMARAGANVLMLERQPEYRDHVRGEIVWPWGVRVAKLLGVEQTLLGGGAQVVHGFEFYDEGALGATTVDVAGAVVGIEGSLNITHPRACGTLTEAAGTAGADVRMGVRDVRIAVGPQPGVRWSESDGTEREVRCKLIIGADGRRSSVRSQTHIPLEVDPPAHLIAGMLVEAVPGMDGDVNVMAREADLIFYSFPQQAGRSRLYLCFPTNQRSRFAGPGGRRRFLGDCRLRCVEDVADWAAATPAGPCATFPGEDSRAPHPLAEGVVLIGDAAGYENPLQGQGLSMALQDVHDVSEALLSGSLASIDLSAYASARATRQRLANLGTVLEVWLNDGCAIQDPDERAARTGYIEQDEVLAALNVCFMTGFDTLPQDLTHAELAGRLAAHQ